ncbi:hypothetical protein EVAR_40223_1 [Eumeta japonica]|uniref:Uncharacterized protein n=1 Tax=Eumeta variegata TaxID=151549 RepID=A0A4C1XBU6_EUMVA|nr:hypothetical protein EVAR_40223_1 [Eumeta japonica]
MVRKKYKIRMIQTDASAAACVVFIDGTKLTSVHEATDVSMMGERAQVARTFLKVECYIRTEIGIETGIEIENGIWTGFENGTRIVMENTAVIAIKIDSKIGRYRR